MKSKVKKIKKISKTKSVIKVKNKNKNNIKITIDNSKHTKGRNPPHKNKPSISGGSSHYSNTHTNTIIQPQPYQIQNQIYPVIQNPVQNPVENNPILAQAEVIHPPYDTYHNFIYPEPISSKGTNTNPIENLIIPVTEQKEKKIIKRPKSSVTPSYNNYFVKDKIETEVNPLYNPLHKQTTKDFSLIKNRSSNWEDDNNNNINRLYDSLVKERFEDHKADDEASDKEDISKKVVFKKTRIRRTNAQIKQDAEKAAELQAKQQAELQAKQQPEQNPEEQVKQVKQKKTNKNTSLDNYFVQGTIPNNDLTQVSDGDNEMNNFVDSHKKPETFFKKVLKNITPKNRSNSSKNLYKNYKKT